MDSLKQLHLFGLTLKPDKRALMNNACVMSKLLESFSNCAQPVPCSQTAYCERCDIVKWKTVKELEFLLHRGSDLLPL